MTRPAGWSPPDPRTPSQFADLILSAGRPLVGHETKQLLVWELARRDPTATGNALAEARDLPPVSLDTQIAAYILNAALRSQTLASICSERLEIELPADGLLGGADHAAMQAVAVAAVREPIDEDLAKDEPLHRLLHEVELPLIPVLATMESVGVAIDREALAGLSSAFATEISRLEQEIYEDVGHQFTIGSPKQLEQVLFYELNLPRGRRTKTGFSTDAARARGSPARRTRRSTRSSSGARTPSCARPTSKRCRCCSMRQTGRLHTTFHQAIASTGRLSSTDPNLQNIPIRSELGRRIRHTFVAGGDDVVLLAADYSQIELRILAHVSGDVHLREAFERRADIHRETAARVLHKEPDDVNADERSMAKMVNFGLAYGMSDFGLSSRANISRQAAQEFINSYFAAYSGISYYMMHIKEIAREQGYVSTLFGRRRWIPELAGSQPVAARRGRADGDQHAHPGHCRGHRQDRHDPRSTSGCGPPGRGRGCCSRSTTSCCSRCRARSSTRSRAIVREEMESAVKLDVPLTVDVKTGTDWESMTPVPA